MQRLLAGSLSRPRMIFSCRSSSLTRLAIAAGSPRPKPWNSQQSKQNHTKTPPKWPEIRASPARSGPESPQPNRDRPPSPAGGCALVGARARARAGAGKSARDPARARVRRPRRRRDDEVVAAASEKGSSLLLLLRCFAARVNRGEKKKLFPRGVCGEVTGRGEEGGAKAAGQPLAGTGRSRWPGRRFLEWGAYGARVAETVRARFSGVRGELDVVCLGDPWLFWVRAVSWLMIPGKC